ncbi:radical SAM protein [Micromonospora sp. DR5-3]|uniref:4Fe-4S single cluster domain-containing protein n=1 Tax=unclassified Micromonospora TaxID=2617518 RepID=UPI0011D5F8C0|nr:MULTISPECIES: 4Fe-4S single cluster domain-containing protein [unclassified Micromonospora]MCW3814441.1 radical SAM protein [Micromonospora sp. DR5-3]TYC22665.1 radical SAM protein [Micromonospora sp. MP36]
MTTGPAGPGTIEISRLHHPVTVLGPGTRAGIWVQGCTIGCAGCLARDTWDRRTDRAVPVRSVLEWLAGLPGPVDGVTISGGEPLQQPGPVAELIAGVLRWRGDREIDVLLYTGYPWTRARRHTAVVAGCDAVVAGPYVERRNVGDLPLRGSANQRIVPLTELGQRRYGLDAALPGRGLQATVTGDRIWMVGIPRAGDLRRMREGLAARGVRIEGASWRS